MPVPWVIGWRVQAASVGIFDVLTYLTNRMNTGKQNTLNELAKLTNCLKVYILLSLPHGAGAHVCGNTYVR